MQNLSCRLILTIKYCISLCREMNPGCSWGLITSVLLRGCLWVHKGNDWFHGCLISPLISMELVAEIVNSALKSVLISLCLSQWNGKNIPIWKWQASIGHAGICFQPPADDGTPMHPPQGHLSADRPWRHSIKAKQERTSFKHSLPLGCWGYLAFSVPSIPERPRGAQKPVTSD